MLYPIAVPIPARRASEGTGFASGAGPGQRPSLARFDVALFDESAP